MKCEKWTEIDLEPCLSSQVIVIDATLNQDITLSYPQTIISDFSHIKCVYLANEA